MMLSIYNRACLGLTVGLIFCLTGTVSAASWRVVPIRLDFDQRVKSGVLTVHNEGETPLGLQMSAAVWSQDAAGKDLYTPTEDLVFFPKVMTVPAKESRVIRSGIKIPATVLEKSYRLFVEEIPGGRRSGESQVVINLRFGVPIFSAPIKAEVNGEIAKFSLKADGAELSVRNKGNIHFRIHNLSLIGRDESGAEVFREKKEGWYLLANAERSYSLPFPEEGCGKAKTVEVLINTDKGDFSAQEKLAAGLCRP